MAGGAPLADVLAEVIASIERYDERLLGTILLLEDDGRTARSVPAPTLSRAYTDALDGLVLGPEIGSCGPAATLGVEVISADLETDRHWDIVRDLVREHALRHCWSFPIRGADGGVLGTFGVYGHEPREPDDEHRRFLRD